MVNSRLTRSQWLRLRLEKIWLEKYYYGEIFPLNVWKYERRIFERKVITSKNTEYGLRIVIGDNYPEEMPHLLVFSSPEPMPKTQKWQGSHLTHTWPQMYGLFQICFYHPTCWAHDYQNVTLYNIFEKGEEWLEAYEEYLETGKYICDILPEMELTEDEK